MSLNNIIVMNRGDTYEFDLTIYDDSSIDGLYHLTGNDTLYFGVMLPHQPFETAIIRKRFTVEDLDEAGNLLISLEPEDTIDLNPGVYYYAIKLHIEHEESFEDTTEIFDKVITVINKTKLILND